MASNPHYPAFRRAAVEYAKRRRQAAAFAAAGWHDVYSAAVFAAGLALDHAGVHAGYMKWWRVGQAVKRALHIK